MISVNYIVNHINKKNHFLALLIYVFFVYTNYSLVVLTVILDKLSGNKIAAAGAQALDLTVKLDLNKIPAELVDKLAGEAPTQQLSFAHNGDFGFSADLEVELDKAYAGKTGNVYRYNENKELELVGSSEISADGKITLSVDKAADYVIVVTENAPAPMSPIWWIVIGVAAVAVVVVVIVVVCAGALAFTVLYNLTNINITERIREIATVEGFTVNDDTIEVVIFSSQLLTMALDSKLYIDDLSLVGQNGIAIPLMSSEVSCYPNPSDGNVILSLSSAEPAEVSFYNALGQRVLVQKACVDGSKFALSEPGVYMMEVIQGGVRTTKTVVIK